MPIAEVATSPVPQDALDRFPGKWVAIRGGAVVAAADDVEELERREDVEPGDVLFLVPDPSTHFYRVRRG